MNIVNLIQGTPEWHAHRAKHFNASDAPAMLGISKYKSRDQLLQEIATGIIPEVDPATQKRFDDGHKFEALARPIAEKIVGEELYPVVGVNGRYSSSFDGLTMDETINYEHKSLNDDIRGCQSITDLDLMYLVQMEQQHMVSDCKKTLFMATKWDKDETLLEQKHFWYEGNPELRQRIIDGWAQFEIDLTNYVPPVVAKKVVAEVVESLPVPAIVARGSLVQSNLNEITPKFDLYLSEVKTELKTDQDFADGEANSKLCRTAAKNLAMTEEQVIGQITEISEAVNILRAYAEKFNAMGLTLEKAVKNQKETIKTNAIIVAKDLYSQYVRSLIDQIGINFIPKLTPPDFAGAIKGVRLLTSMQSNINEALNAAKLDAKAMFDDISAKLSYLNEAIKGYEGLFADKTTLVYSDREYLKLLVKTRIDEQMEKDAKREAEVKAKASAEAVVKLAESNVKLVETAEPLVSQFKHSFQATVDTSSTDKDIIVRVVSGAYGISEEMALDLLIQTFGNMQKAA